MEIFYGRVFALAKQSGYQGPFFTKWADTTEIDKELDRKKSGSDSSRV